MGIIHLVRDFEDVVINYGKENGLIFSENDRAQAVIRILNFNRKIGSRKKKLFIMLKISRFQRNIKNELRIYYSIYQKGEI